MCASYGHTARFTEAGVKANHGTKGTRQGYRGIFDCPADLDRAGERHRNREKRGGTSCCEYLDPSRLDHFLAPRTHCNGVDDYFVSPVLTPKRVILYSCMLGRASSSGLPGIIYLNASYAKVQTVNKLRTRVTGRMSQNMARL